MTAPTPAATAHSASAVAHGPALTVVAPNEPVATGPHLTHALHACYRTGALLDAVTVVPLVWPRAAAAMLGVDHLDATPAFRYACFVGAALMTGWTALLLWADRRPLERRGVLLLTGVPVLAGLIAASVYALASGLVDPGHGVPMLLFQCTLTTAFLGTFRAAAASAAGRP